jgi:hypothetical protein
VKLESKLLVSLGKRAGNVVLRRDFSELAGPTQLSEGISRLVGSGRLVRLGAGLYAKAQRGEVTNLTGLDSPYEAPEAPDLYIDTVTMSADGAAEQIVRLLDSRAPLGSVPQ